VTEVVVIGLGIMGGAIAGHLADAGVAVTGYDRSLEARRAARGPGVSINEDFRDLPADAPVIILSLPGFAAAQEVVAEIADRWDTPVMVVETSTLALEEKLALRGTLLRAGHTMVDCPISGTGAQIQRKDVVIYASGDSDAVDRVAATLQLFSRQVLKLGAFGNGTRMKLIANYLVAVHNVAAAEAVLLGEKAGFSMETLMAAIAPGAGSSRMFELRGPSVAERRYLPAGMKLSLWAKDMDLIASFVRDLNVPTPLFDTVAPLYESALAAGYGDQDTASVAEVLRLSSRENNGKDAEEN
jgi:putative dehydrogenase